MRGQAGGERQIARAHDDYTAMRHDHPTIRPEVPFGAYAVELGDDRPLFAGPHPGYEGEDYIAQLLRAGVRCIVDVSNEDGPGRDCHLTIAAVAQRLGLPTPRRLELSIADFKAPMPDQSAAVRGLVAGILAAAAAGERPYVHCLGGIGRTGLIVGCVLRADHSSGGGAIEQLRGCRLAYGLHGDSPETLAQERYVDAFTS